LIQKNPKFLIDVGVGKKVEEWMKTLQYDTKTIRDLNPRMPDIEILKIAVAEKRLLITMDKDFGELVYKSRRSYSGVLLLRLEDESTAEKIKVLETILNNYASKIANKFSVYKKNKLRIKNPELKK
jgi:predicted nuclease of predicted toxin-antitoxin system